MTTVPQSPVPVRYGLASRDRERRWTVIVDVVLVTAVLGWFALLAVGGLHATVTVVAGVVLTAMVVHRVLILLERHRSSRGPRSSM
ncbi:hypothetical protein [Nocardioides aurantiacus]|uniref:Uncharacterized protein n=1 Tax=Nocardioides aurantiacus TaxID=86796 RepID=A0A3N2CY12_9ACTN|nr:hypothetical protein [Nocardioides aurantiacus]ROR92421.1 hypothetical protein EDD33_3311 [Nocardioides aurantiacus]